MRSVSDLSLDAPETNQSMRCPPIHLDLRRAALISPREDRKLAKRIVISKHRRAAIQPALMRRYNVTERGALVKHIVPRQGKASVLGSVFQEKIRHHPRAVLKLGDVGGRILR